MLLPLPLPLRLSFGQNMRRLCCCCCCCSVAVARCMFAAWLPHSHKFSIFFTFFFCLFSFLFFFWEFQFSCCRNLLKAYNIGNNNNNNKYIYILFKPVVFAIFCVCLFLSAFSTWIFGLSIMQIHFSQTPKPINIELTALRGSVWPYDLGTTIVNGFCLAFE